ncbi:hypothetical protein AH156_20115 [Salmonella enterica subsp. enterica serovar Enteritidis]|nr:hypothetical protein [Salmonella enterica subsp. enterica serovar Enteritidis]
MTFLFSTPRRHRLAAAAFIAASVGNILAHPFMHHGVWLDLSGRGIFGTIVDLGTLLLLGMAAGHISGQGGKQDAFIKLMEEQGFIYDPATREFRPDGNKK